MSELLTSDANYLLNKIQAIEELEELDLCDDKMYLEKIILLQNLANGGKGDAQRVWGEYSLVSQITKQPVLMNKAMSIALTKEEVADLISDLNKDYAKEISFISPKNKVGLIFSVTDRGHARSDTFEITLPKLGDWRFGYTGVYSAELIFHEFSHALDFNRTMGSNVHRHDFVNIVDNMLIKFKDFIEKRYVPINQRNQILENNSKLVYYHFNKEEIEKAEKLKETEEIQKKKLSQDEIYSKIGLTANSFPVSYILGENPDVKKSYLKFALNSYKDKARTPEQKDALKSILAKLNEDEIVLNKNEMSFLNLATQNTSRSSFLASLPMKEQFTAGSYITKFETEINNLSKGVIEDLEVKEKYRVRSYSDADMLKKYGYED
jgi:hypothetical protein